MKPLRVYVDTSVFGGVEDVEFSETSRRFFEGVAQGKFVVLLSRLVVEELVLAPARVLAVLEGLTESQVATVEITPEAEALADAYLESRVVGPRSRADALHVAVATVCLAEVIVSWNFRHIVNYRRIQQFNAVNLANGYGLIDIRSPLEMDYGTEDE